MTERNDKRRIEAVILAAGKGTRMEGDLPKVLHRVADRPMARWVIDACREAGAERLVVVVGYEADMVRDELAGEADVAFVEQTEQLGTGHAVRMAEPAFAGRDACDLLVVAGDMPLFRAATLASLIEAHREAGAAATLATGVLAEPGGYGRIVRDAAGGFERIVEHKDADDAQRAIREVNVSCYCFDSDKLFDALRAVTTNNVQGEYYVTDVLGILRDRGETVLASNIAASDEVEGINTTDQLARVDGILRQRLSQETGR